MKKIRIGGYILLLVAVVIGAVGFSKNECQAKPRHQFVETDAPFEEQEKEPNLKLNRESLRLKVGKEKKLKAYNAFRKVKWESSNTEIATVSQTGKVTGKKYGTVTVRAISGNQKAECKVTVYVSKKRVNQWLEKNGRCYYYGKYGQKVTGRKELGGKTYYFDKEGRQRTGWLNIGEDYFFYNIAKGADGYLVTNEIINQIEIDASGKAKVEGSGQTRAHILARCNHILFENTDWTMTRSEALKKLFVGFAQGKSIVYKNIGGFKNQDGWPEAYAMVYLKHGYGDCYTVGCVYAYLAAALGCKEVYAQSSGGHGWCSIEGKYYDPNWAFWGTENIDDGFAAPEELSGRGGRPNWKSAAAYSAKIS